MHSIQPLPRTLHLHSSIPFFLLTNTNPNVVEFNKNVVNMDIVTWCKWKVLSYVSVIERLNLLYHAFTHMQLLNIQQKTTKHVEVYYEHLLKLTNFLKVRTTNVFLTTIFKEGLLPYLILVIVGMKRDTLTEHKEATIVC
jgi:hypothetical protein